MNTTLPLWAEGVVAALLVASGLASLVAATGLLRAKDFFQRMHPPALVSTFGAWCVTLASVVYFSFAEGRLELKTWLVIILLAISAPITTVMLAGAALFRRRMSGDAGSVPPPLAPLAPFAPLAPPDPPRQWPPEPPQ